MKIVPLIAAIIFGIAGFAIPTFAQTNTDTRCFELRTYHALPGRLDALNARFRNHTLKLFAKHGMTSVGYWMPMNNTNNLLIYMLAYPSRDARKKSWAEFSADPEWQAAQKASEADGKIVGKVDSVFLATTDYSPPIVVSQAATPRAFELRTYHAAPGKLDALNARFRDHTVALFDKHGLTQIGYWMPTDEKQGAGNTLIYLLAHKSREGSVGSWKAFRDDSDWVKARKASEASGPLTIENGVESVFMVPTDYSPTK